MSSHENDDLGSRKQRLHEVIINTENVVMKFHKIDIMGLKDCEAFWDNLIYLIITLPLLQF